MQWATNKFANHSLDSTMDACRSENAKCYIFEISTKSKFTVARLEDFFSSDSESHDPFS